MRRREFFVFLGGAMAAWPIAARAQQKPVVISFLGAGAADSSAHLLAALKIGLKENGLVEGKDYSLEQRMAEGHYERFPALARGLVDQGVRVIVVNTIAAAHAARRATTDIPIVMATMNDPVGNGLIESLARPGGNITGLATLNQDVTPKLLDLFRSFFPNATAIGALLNPENPSNLVYADRLKDQAAPLGVTVQNFAVKAPDELNAVFGQIAAQRPDAVFVIPDAALLDLREPIAALARQHRIPVVSTDGDLTSVGGLISYGISRRENFRRSAYYVKKVLDGVKPADLPVEQPTRILLSVNVKTAKELGLAVPPTLLTLADEVFE